MHSTAALAVTLADNVSRTFGRATVATVRAMLVAVVWVALLAIGVVTLCGQLGRMLRDVVTRAHFQIH
jgi:hypothetical protein